MQFESIPDTQPFTVRGIVGKFSVVGSKWKICHFSTFASSENDSSAGNTSRLLNELKPMRERVKPAEIKDMSSLLQRDLDDSRVANELIPYLLSNKASIGFFPAVLCALMPKRFLSQNSDDKVPILYPDPADENGDASGNRERDYLGYWKLKTYGDKGKETAFAMLTINPSKTDLIVLDGQHRSNAFRFLTKTFATDDREIYSLFYKNIEVPEEFNSELPVTIIWFEKIKDDPIDPKLISRRLFVDVNTTAKKVNDSRNILLNDQSFPSVFTAIFYSLLAKQGFDEKSLSLLHGAFDSDIEKNKSDLALFSPTVIEYAFRCFCLGKTDYDNLNIKIKVDASDRQNNTDRLKRFFRPANKTKCVSNLSPSNISIREEFNETGAKYIHQVLSKFSLCALTLKATADLATNLRSDAWASSARTEVWERVYCGGEGLFSSFVGSNDDTIRNGTYSKAIKEIEQKFIEIRSSFINDDGKKNVTNIEIKKAYDAFLSKASITGLVMALSKLYETHGWAFEIINLEGKKEKIDTVEHFIYLLNKISPKQWIVVLTEFKLHAVGKELKPTLWPSIRNLYLRVLEGNELADPIFNTSPKLNWFKNQFEISPDFYFIKSIVTEKVMSFKTVNNDIGPDKVTLKTYFAEAEKELITVLHKAGLTSIKPARFKWERWINEFINEEQIEPAQGAEENTDDE
jgi:hypothetical protein